MNRVAPLPTFPDVQDATFRLRLHDYMREHATALNQAAEGRLWVLVSVTGTYSAGDNDGIICVAPTGTCAITLPTASAAINRRIVVKRTNNTTHTITVSGSTGNIDGAASVTLTTAYQAREFFSDGSNYWTV